MGQLTLLGGEIPSFDAEFQSLRRITLANGAWLDVETAWLRGHAGIFDTLLRTTAWRHERRVMYERVLDTPRLYGVLPDDGPGHPIIEAMRLALSTRYATSFDRVSVALYRDGRDSVAWHGDRIARRMSTALVASVSVGAPRRFLLRPHQPAGQSDRGPTDRRAPKAAGPPDRRAPKAAGGTQDAQKAPDSTHRTRSMSMTLGWGDLLVMGGTCQRTWQHSVPKVAAAPPRIVIMFRPTWEAPVVSK
jgi:alkylated DNA repair dioxygenase AlkB